MDPSVLLALPDALVALLAVLPAVARWWTARRLAPDDPALPERLMVRRAADGQVTAVCLAALLVLGWRDAWWSVPLLLLARAAAGYPLRRRVFGETWSLPVYLAWVTRVVVGIWGFWLLLAAAPLLVHRSPWPAVAIGAALAVVLAAWSRYHARAVLWCLGARPLASASWPPGFRRVLDAARLASPPRLWRTGPRGSSVANAIALPSLLGSHVLFSDPLLEQLDADEQAAVLAHEVSHLELFTPALLARWRIVDLAMIIVAVGLAPLATRLPAWAHGVPLAVFPAAVLGVLVSRGRVIRSQETPSDLRAVELCGNAEAVVTGLVKLHETGKLPRRWASEHEQRASHPSLARRIRAIRQAAGHAAASVQFPVVVRGSDSTALVMDAERVRHLSGVPADAVTADALVAGARTNVAAPWAEVAELRVDAPRRGAPVLVLGLATGERRAVQLDPHTIPSVQAALDLLDDRLPETVPVPAGRHRGARVALIVLLATALVALSWSSALVPLALALILPSPAALIGSAVAALTASLVTMGHATSMTRAWLAALALAPALWVAWGAWRWRKAGGPADRVVHVGVGLAAVALWVVALIHSRGDLYQLHVVIRVVSGTIVLPLALASLWSWSAEPRYRRGALVPLLLAAVGLVLSAPAFVDAVLRDPLRIREPAFDVSAAALDPIASAPVDAGAGQLWLSPSGRVFAVASDVDEETDEPMAFTVGDFTGHTAAVRADGLALPDDETVVALEREGDHRVLRAHPRGALAQTSWSVSLPTAAWGALTVDPASRRWRFETSGPEALRRFEGVLGTGALEQRSWNRARGPRGDYVQWIATDAEPLGQVYDYAGLSTPSILVREWLELPWRMPLVVRLGTTGEVRSRFDGGCYQGTPGVPVACVARDSRRSYVWTWNGAALAPAGWLDGDFTVQGRGATGWLAGWRRGRITIADPASARAFEFAGTCEGGTCLTMPTYTGTVVGGLIVSAGTTRVATYRLRPLSPPPPR